MSKRLSLCMVVRNEAKALPKLFKHVKSVVDEMVIFDQSSDDETPQICEDHGARVIETTRKNLADIDRQDCYNLATGDYVLALDADEKPDAKMMQFLGEIKEGNGKHHIYWFSFRNIVNGVDIKEILQEDWHPRLWIRADNMQPVLEWPQQAHTFPKFNSDNHLFCTRGKVDHVRTLEKIKRVQSERSSVIDPQNRQLEENFGQAVEDLLARKKGRRNNGR